MESDVPCASAAKARWWVLTWSERHRCYVVCGHYKSLSLEAIAHYRRMYPSWDLIDRSDVANRP